MRARCLILSACILLGAAAGHAEMDAWQDAEINPFHKTYLSLELARNYPLAQSLAHFEPGELHPMLTYRHNLDSHWMMGIGGQFKLLNRRSDDDTPPPSQTLALLTVSHETLYILRLSHPMYAFFGPKIMYMLPALTAKLPLERDTSTDMEIGGALSFQLARMLNDRWILTLRVDLWRGTKTMRLHGLEAAFGVMHAWD